MEKNTILTAKALQEAFAAAAGDPAKIEALTKQAVASLATQESNLETVTNMNAELQEANEAQKKTNPNYRPEVKLKSGDTYRILHGVSLPTENGSKVLSVDDIAADQKVLKQLIDNGSTAVVKLPKV